MQHTNTATYSSFSCSSSSSTIILLLSVNWTHCCSCWNCIHILCCVLHLETKFKYTTHLVWTWDNGIFEACYGLKQVKVTTEKWAYSQTVKLQSTDHHGRTAKGINSRLFPNSRGEKYLSRPLQFFQNQLNRSLNKLHMSKIGQLCKNLTTTISCFTLLLATIYTPFEIETRDWSQIQA